MVKKYSDGAQMLIAGIVCTIIACIAFLGMILLDGFGSPSNEFPDNPRLECILKIDNLLSEEEFLEKLKNGRVSVECEQKMTF